MNRRSFISLPPACLLSGLLPFPAYAVAPAKRKVVFSGFEPFAKRKVNASFQLAKYLTGECQDMDCQTVEVPVIWGEPKKTIQAHWPGAGGLWVAFGEGSPAGVAVETVADNRRDDFPDNRYALPATHEIEAGGPARLHQNFPVERLVAKLKESGIAARASSQAGHYLCEEMLYELLFYREKSQDQVPATVLFIHVPPWDSLIQTTANEEVQADEAWFRQLAKIMMPTILAVVGE